MEASWAKPTPFERPLRSLVHYNGGAEGIDEELRDEYLRFDRSLLVNDPRRKGQSTNSVVGLDARSRSRIDEGEMMIIPVRCFSCGAVIAHKWEEYKQMVADGKSESEAMDDVGLKRYCCRRMYVGHLDLIEEVAPFSAARN